MKKVQLILCRHTETEYNREDRITGQRNIPLTMHGLEDASLLAHELEILPIRAIFCSDLLRAQQTANPIAIIHNLRVILDRRLREASAGRLEGLLRKEAYATVNYETPFSTDSHIQ